MERIRAPGYSLISIFSASFSGSYLLVSSAGRGYPATKVFCGAAGCGVDAACVESGAAVRAACGCFEHPAERISAPSEIATTNVFAFLMLVSLPGHAALPASSAHLQLAP